MIQMGFESRIKVQQIINNQLPEFILDESPKAAEFLKQYYISQEYQGGTVDIAENLDQYLKLDNLTPEVVVGFTTLSSAISSSATTIQVSSTKGFPPTYGLLKIDNEIITYTGLTTNTFTGCIRGFSGITNYHKDLSSEELVFSDTDQASHTSSSKVQNLSVLFLQEFYKKLKITLTPELENKDFVSNLNVGNFIKEVRTLYRSKGTDESFKILFNVLFGETPKVIDLERFLSKPSSASYSRRAVIVADAISGDLSKLKGQTIFKNTDTNTSASVSEVEVIRRKGKTYYKIFLFIGYDDSFSTITGQFNITGSTKNLEYVDINSTNIIVDSTIGFPKSGKVYCGENVIKYTDKSINEFFGCSGITSGISTASTIYSDETYYGYENGDLSKKVIFRITGVLSGYNSSTNDSSISVGENIKIKNIGEIIKNPEIDKTYKEIFANSWIYNTSSRYQVSKVISTTQLLLADNVDKSSLKVGDDIDILIRDTQIIVRSNLKINEISGNEITILVPPPPDSIDLSSLTDNYDIRRKIKKSVSSSVPLEFNSTFADIQNVYNENDEYLYVTSNSLPSYQITKSIFSYNASNVSDQNSTTGLYSKIVFSSKISFITGSEVYYKPSGSPISGLSEGVYYVEVFSGNLEIRLYASRSVIGTENYISFGSLSSGIHNFTLNSQKERILSPQKLLRKFPLEVNIGDGESDLTTPGTVGQLINGVEIISYKSNDKVYYGPLESVDVLNGGDGYDVINPPLLSVSTGNALLQPIVNGSVEKIYVTPQDFDLDVVVSVAITGGNGFGAVFEPVIEKRRREIEFDARQTSIGGGVDITYETITFLTDHNLVDGQPIVYRPGNNPLLGIGTFNGLNENTGNTLKSESTYYTKFISNNTIQLYQSLSDYRSGINTVGFTTAGNSGIQKFATEPKNTLSQIKVLNGGSNYTNRKLRVTSSGISTETDIVSFTNHGFTDGDLVTYFSSGSTISGLSTSNQYYILKTDNDKFRLSDAGVGGTNRSNYLRRKYISLGSTGSGYHTFNYPEISIDIKYSPVGLGTTQYSNSISVSPIVRGKIVGVYVYEQGSDYGSSILNYHKKPSILVKTGKNAQLYPTIINGRITSVSVLYSGTEYYSTPDIVVSGSGIGAILQPVIVNNKISRIIIVNGGSGYSTTDTLITAVPTGKNIIFDPQVRSLDINNNFLYNDVNSTTIESNEIIKSSNNNLQYFISGHSVLTTSIFKDDGIDHSPIIGWAYDGNPIYGSYGYPDPKNKNSKPIKRLTSGYTSNTNNILNRPSEFSNGFFIQDYKFTNSGDLDEYNGRFCVTPEFPNGVYAYFATSIIDSENNIVGSFPYFIGDRYRSKFVNENKTLNQSFDFNNSNLIRNTFPYKVNSKYADNDFIIESNEIINQSVNVESIVSGSIDNFEIIDSGDDYKVGDLLQFDETNTDGGGLISQVELINGKEILNLQTSIESYYNATFTWNSKDKIKVKINPNHNLKNSDYVNISDFSTSLSFLNGYQQIGVSSYTSTLIKNITASANITDIYVSNIPENISIGSSIGIGTETLSVLNIFDTQNIVRVSRELPGISHTLTTTVNFIPDTFTINKSTEYFESKFNDKIYFNPKYSVGVGTTSGIGVAVTFNVGIQTNNIISIPTQSIYLPNHSFKTNQEVIFKKLSSSSQISVANTSGSSSFNLPFSGDSQTVYIIKKSPDYVGIVTQIGLTTTTDGLFFISNGSDDYQYSLESNFIQVKGNIEKIDSLVTITTSHNLTSGDIINLSIKPSLSVGIGTSTSIKVKRDSLTNYILINPIEFNSSGINTLTDEITLPSHNLKTGNKVKYSANNVSSGLTTGFYYVYKVDNNKIKLCETYVDSIDTISPNIVNISSIGGSSQIISLVNPPLTIFNNNNIIFDLSDSSLSGYNFKIFYDQNFKDEFISTGLTTTFSISKNGIIGVSPSASLTIDNGEGLPNPLFYTLEKSGHIIASDKEVKNYSQINFVDSYYNNSYKISGVGATTFTISLKNYPEKTSYNQSECDILKYTTSSISALGGVFKIRTISPGYNFKKLPTFNGINSVLGSGAYIIPKSNSIGKVNQIRILNEGFEYSSDKTLKPEALIPSFITIKNSKTIESISIIDGGKNYTYRPDLIIVDTNTGNKIDTGLLTANVSGSSINSISIEVQPNGLPESIVTVRAINNTNGVGIQSIQASSSGIVTCFIVTPLSGFEIEPFAQYDRIFVEGVQKSNQNDDGVNSEDYGYQFFTITEYNNVANPRKLEFSLSGLTTNPGTPKIIENLYGTIVNYNNYPKFNVTQKFSNFIIGEILEVNSGNGFSQSNLRITESNNNYIKVTGSDVLQKNNVLRGIESGSLATVNSIKESSGQFTIDYASIQRIGWLDDTGKLDEDTQVISDNNYYQNLSYSIKSKQEWNDIISPINNIVHPIGLKNFADTEIIENVTTGEIISTDQIKLLYNLSSQNRVDTINNYDLVVDVDTFGDSSKFLKFSRKILSDYFECKTNRVLEIDDISSEFSSSDKPIDTSTKIVDIIPANKYNRYLVQVSNKDYSQSQFTEIIVLNNNSDIFTLEKGSISTELSPEFGYETNIMGDVFGYIDELGNCYLKFDPKDGYDTTYNIKYLNTRFTNYTSGIGTTSIGYVDLFGVTSTVSPDSTSNLIQKSTSKLESIHSGIHLINNVTNEMSYVEIFVDHDGTNTNLSEFYFDTKDGLSSNFIGSFGASISSGILSLQYTNTSSNSITLRTRNVGFGTTAIGAGTYRFKQTGQVDGYESTVKYDSLYSNVSTASTIIGFDTNDFTSIKSTIKVSIGQTSALHQVMLISDSSNVYTTQYPFLSIGSTSGIGTFGGEMSGSIVSLVFYPDPSISGDIEILSFNESFYRENDEVNIPPSLNYSNVTESVGVAKYFAINDQDINKLDFELKYQGIPIFMKTFNPSDSSILDQSTGKFTIVNHFFSTGEELIYRPKSTFVGVAASSVGIGSTLNHVGVVTDILPQTVYAIKVSNDVFKLATRKEYANNGIAVTFTSIGSGNAHELEMVKKNEKSLISIDNVIQSPIAYSLLDYTVNNGGTIGTSSTIFGLSGISSIQLGDILKIDNEYMKVENVGLGTTYSGPISFAGTFPLVSVRRGFVGSSATSHSDSTSVSVYRGSFNITNSRIYFTEPPEGSLEDQLFIDYDNLAEARSYFNGRVFLRKDYTSNQVYDNLSEKFTGIGQTYTLTVGGANTVGLGTSGGNGIVLINGIYQTPTTENNTNNNFRIIENSSIGISSVIFSGITSSNGSIIISESDVNLNQLPRGGIIVSLGSTPGLGYAPLIGAAITAIIGAGGSITSIGIGTSGSWGSGYRSPVSIAVTESGHTGLGATINAVVGAGGTLSFVIVGGGTNYTNPTINISSPSYSNLSMIGVSRLSTGATTECGIGLLLNVDVGASSTTGIGSTLFEVTGFDIVRNGYGFKKGDVIKPVGLVTAYGLTQPITEFELTILDTFTDSFSAWQFGELDYIDSIKNLQNGVRKRFPLYYNSQLLSFERSSSDEDSRAIDFNSLLVIFVNGILQQPVATYQFDGGASFAFTEAPKSEDNVSIYFYKGSPSDSQYKDDVYETIKSGDDVQVFSNNNSLTNTITQSSRTVTNIISSKVLETNLYNLQGVDDTNFKPVSWTKQKVDKIINGYLVSKARESLEPQIYPTSKIIKNVSQNDSQIFVDDISLFNYEAEPSVDFDALIVSGLQDPISGVVTAVVSSAGTIQSLVISNVGSGYTGSSIEVNIASPLPTIVAFGTTLSVTPGTRATASISIINGSLSTVSIINAGSGYTTSNLPQVIIPLPDPIYENITKITNISGTSGNVIGIGTTVGIGTDLALNFTLSSMNNIEVGNPIYIFNTKVGNGVTSIINDNSSIVGVGTTFLDNVYYISGKNVSAGIITCNVHSQTSIVGIATTGSNIGKFSWGKLSGFTRSSSPISIGISGFTINSGLSTFPTIQRRGFGLKGIGPIS